MHALDLGAADRVEEGGDLVRDEEILPAMQTGFRCSSGTPTARAARAACGGACSVRALQVEAREYATAAA
ncbi:MAG: hypothetical protein M3P15_08945 [Actinomycetota bacterium]|nr:hypothetical protein [Actinomycetota bacterium]